MQDLWLFGEKWLNVLFGFNSRLHPLFIFSLVLIGVCIYVLRRPKVSFIQWLFPREIYTHPSHITDIKLFLFNSVLKVGGLLNVAFINVIIVYYTLEFFGRSEAVVTSYTPFLIGIIFLIVGDFCTYWVHRIHHQWKVVWPFHAVHHSAEVMTPVTVYRKHPIYDLFSKTFYAIVIGFVQGLILSVFVGKLPIFLIVGTSGFYFLFDLLGSNFRHSHVWISYGRFFEHIFISPAQHQIHHSLSYKHWNKNYGEVFAIWDWMFGTLYVPNEREDLAFGLSNIEGERIEQPYPNLAKALYEPLCESWAEISKISRNVTSSGETLVDSQ